MRLREKARAARRLSAIAARCTPLLIALAIFSRSSSSTFRPFIEISSSARAWRHVSRMVCRADLRERKSGSTALWPKLLDITSSGSRSIATRCWKARCGSGYERLSGRCAENWASRSYPAFCRENVSICSWKFRRISPSATSYGASRDGRRIGCRWSSRACASATGGRANG